MEQNTQICLEEQKHTNMLGWEGATLSFTPVIAFGSLGIV